METVSGKPVAKKRMNVNLFSNIHIYCEKEAIIITLFFVVLFLV